MKFFFDNCMSPYHAKGMRGFAELQRDEIVHLRERFDEDTKDVDWISALGREGDWIIISGDQRITRNPIEKAAWRESNLTAFFFAGSWSNDGHWKKAAALVSWWETIRLQARKTPKGHGFLMPKNGSRLQQIFP